METANPILGNPLLIAAILLFLAILPRALRQKEKTALDRTVERFKKFEKEELKVVAEENLDQNDPEHENSASPKDRTLDYLKEEMLTALKTQDSEEIPPFPVQEEEKEKPVKIVKEGVVISHNKAADPPPAPRKKTKLIKQEMSIAPSGNRAPSKKASSAPLKGKESKTPAKDQESTWDEGFKAPPIDNYTEKESDDNWVEAEIPGLIIEPPPAAESSESIPTFKASQKAKHPSAAKKSQKSPPKEKQGVKVKNMAPKSEEKKDSTPKKADSPELEIEISESKPKAVEIKAPVVSHKNIAKKKTAPEKAKAPSSKTGKTQKTEAEVTVVPRQRENIKPSPGKAGPKPFLLDLKYLDRDAMETESPVSHEKIPADMVDVMIARLNALQSDLENQLASIPGERITRENPRNGNIRKDRIQDSHPDLEETIKESSDKKEVSLEELDSFLFTTTQRKK